VALRVVADWDILLAHMPKARQPTRDFGTMKLTGGDAGLRTKWRLNLRNRQQPPTSWNIRCHQPQRLRLSPQWLLITNLHKVRLLLARCKMMIIRTSSPYTSLLTRPWWPRTTQGRTWRCKIHVLALADSGAIHSSHISTSLSKRQRRAGIMEQNNNTHTHNVCVVLTKCALP
jgi:hypothetical protein